MMTETLPGILVSSHSSSKMKIYNNVVFAIIVNRIGLISSGLTGSLLTDYSKLYYLKDK